MRARSAGLSFFGAHGQQPHRGIALRSGDLLVAVGSDFQGPFLQYLGAGWIGFERLVVKAPALDNHIGPVERVKQRPDPRQVTHDEHFMPVEMDGRIEIECTARFQNPANLPQAVCVVQWTNRGVGFLAQGGVRPQARFWGITGHYRPPDAWFSHVQRKIGAGQGAYRPVDTCLDERIPGLYFLST